MGSMGSMGAMASGYGGNGGAGASSREGGLTPGWLAAFGTGGYEDEPPLLEELGVNFGHIKMKVCVYGFDGSRVGLIERYRLWQC